MEKNGGLKANILADKCPEWVEWRKIKYSVVYTYKLAVNGIIKMVDGDCSFFDGNFLISPYS